jgi:predicted nucleic acid-binding protein
VTLDTGALIALERGDGRIVALLQRAVATGVRLRVPAGVVGQAWRDGAQQARLARFLRTSQVEIVPLDGDLARACGELCAASRTRDVIDASVVITAREHDDVILTSDMDDLRRLDPSVRLERV